MKRRLIAAAALVAIATPALSACYVPQAIPKPLSHCDRTPCR